MPDLAYLQNNPYLAASLTAPAPNKWSTIGGALAALGSGISRAGMAGQPWLAGVGPGAEMAVNQMNAEDVRRFQQALATAQFGQQEAYRKAQEESLKAQTKQRRQDLAIDRKVMGMIPGMGGNAPGFDVKPPAIQMGPQPGGGVNSNNVGNVRPVGSSTGFQQPPAVKNVRAYPAAFNQGQPMNLMQIGERWAPKGDGANDPKAWAFNVARFSGLDPNQPLDLNNPQVAAAFARGVHGAERGAGAVRPAADYSGGVQLAQGSAPSGNPQIAPSPGGNVMPPRIDPLPYAALAMSKRFAPFANQMVAIGNKETDRYLADLERTQKQEQFNRTATREESNAEVGPDGKPNKAVIDAAAEAAALPAEKVPAQFFQPGDTGAAAMKEFLAANDANPGAIDAMKGFIADKARQATDVGAFLKQNGPAIETLDPALARQLGDAVATRNISAGFRGSTAGKFLGGDLDAAVKSTLGASDSGRRMQTLRMAVGSNPEAVQGLQKAILDDFRRSAGVKVAEDAAGNARLTANGAETWLQANRGAIANVLNPQQVAGLEAITRSLKDQGQAAVKVAGADATRNLATKSIVEALPWKGAGDTAWLGSIRKTLGLVYGDANEKIADRLLEVMRDPKLAAALMKKATPGNAKMAEPVLLSIGRAAALPAARGAQ
jgi:hypothetical protein